MMIIFIITIIGFLRAVGKWPTANAPYGGSILEFLSLYLSLSLPLSLSLSLCLLPPPHA